MFVLKVHLSFVAALLLLNQCHLWCLSGGHSVCPTLYDTYIKINVILHSKIYIFIEPILLNIIIWTINTFILTLAMIIKVFWTNLLRKELLCCYCCSTCGHSHPFIFMGNQVLKVLYSLQGGIDRTSNQK